jgi:tripartite-type tricarboxylate transporter receptor subunit TctC
MDLVGPCRSRCSGLQGGGWQILAAPNGTPEAIIRKVSDDLAKVANDPDINRKLAQLDSHTCSMTPAQATAFVQEEQKTWKPVLEKIAANIK